jgi:hypothetical protein
MTAMLSQLLADPRRYIDVPYTQGFDLTREDLDTLHLGCARASFSVLRERIPALARHAADRNVAAIGDFGDLAAVLFPHTIYKSYPRWTVERGDFARLTHWLGELTTTPLHDVDLGGIETLDQWIQRLDASTEVRVVHSFGTTGKLSFIPRAREEWHLGARLIANCIEEWKPNAGISLARAKMPIVQPFYRYGASAVIRGAKAIEELFAGGEDDVLFLYPDLRFSADVASFAGRLAGPDGEDLGSPVSPALAAVFERFASTARERPARLQEFFERARTKFGGRDVYLFGLWPTLFSWAEAGLSRGIRNAFGPRSVLHTGGGTKGLMFPEGWQERIFEFLGFRNAHEFYAMTELIPACPRCAAGNYHIPPVLVPILLDPAGRPMPRRGSQTGRLAFLDLLATTYWGGFITGDEATLAGWDDPCSCGRSGPYVLPQIRRIAEAEGGDDKINCAGVARSYDEALEELARAYGRRAG